MPVRISHRIAPSPNTSARRSRLAMSPLACSGGMYAGVPSIEPASVSVPKLPAEPLLRAVRIVRHVLGRDGRLAFSSSAMPPSASTLARPQSITCTSPKAPTMMFAGFRSRWMTPLAWA